jgi:hypothetical protein
MPDTNWTRVAAMKRLQKCGNFFLAGNERVRSPSVRGGGTDCRRIERRRHQTGGPCRMWPSGPEEPGHGRLAGRLSPRVSDRARSGAVTATVPGPHFSVAGQSDGRSVAGGGDDTVGDLCRLDAKTTAPGPKRPVVTNRERMRAPVATPWLPDPAPCRRLVAGSVSCQWA